MTSSSNSSQSTRRTSDLRRITRPRNYERTSGIFVPCKEFNNTHFFNSFLLIDVIRMGSTIVYIYFKVSK